MDHYHVRITETDSKGYSRIVEKCLREPAQRTHVQELLDQAEQVFGQEPRISPLTLIDREVRWQARKALRFLKKLPETIDDSLNYIVMVLGL